MALTQEEKNRLISETKFFMQQSGQNTGATHPKVQELLDRFPPQNVGVTAPQEPQVQALAEPEIVEPPEVIVSDEQEGGFLKKIGSGVKKLGEFFTRAEREFGRTLGASLVAPGIAEQIKEGEAKQAELSQQLRERLEDKPAEERAEALRRLQTIEGSAQFDIEDIVPEAAKTTQQIIGEAAGVGLDVLSAGTFGKAANVVRTTPVGSLGQTFARGFIKEAPKGALFGAGFSISQELRDNSDFQEIAQSAVTGGLSGGIVSGVLGGVFAAGPKIGAKLKENAASQYKKGLSATKEKYKQKADKVIPDLLEGGFWGRQKKLLDKASRGIQLASKEYEELGKLQGVLEIDGLINTVDDSMNALKLRSGRISSVNQSKFRALQNLKDDLLALDAFDGIGDKVAYQQELRELAQDYGEILFESRKSAQTIADSATLSQIKKVDGAIRNLLNTKNPEFSKINRVYHLNSELFDIVSETVQRQAGQKGSLTKVLAAIGAIGGMGAGGAPGAVAGGALLSGWAKLVNSTVWNTFNAVQKNKLADALMGMTAPQMSNAMNFLINQGVKGVTQLLNRDNDVEQVEAFNEPTSNILQPIELPPR